MAMTQEEATHALNQATEAGRRSKTLRGYRSGSPHLILWAGIWAVAYSLNYFRPGLRGVPWLVLIPAGIAGDFWIARADRAPSSRGTGIFLGIAATAFAFITATFQVLPPHDPRQIGAFVALVVAASYILLGTFTGPRLIWTGMALGALTLLGFFAFPAVFPLWMALVGGGALALGGFWLRTI